ncbi:MAG: chloride channel protein [Immundisolibacterales bacterium]|nr:chloride channel protein [Immundisolibacterales bacterium]
MRRRRALEPSPAARIAWSAALGMAVGVVASLAAIGFVDLVLLLNEWLLISPRSRFMQDDRTLLLVATVLVPAAGGLVVGLVHHYLIPERRPHGPPDIIRAVQGLDGVVPPRSGVLSALTSLVSLGAGASVGQYGPLAHLGATFGSLVARLTRHTERNATVWVGCGVAAAISTAFNAPLAGIVFAHEVILRHYSLRAFAPITVAAAVGHVVANVVFERPPLFRVESLNVVAAPEFLGFILIGVAGAFVAVLYMRAILLSSRIARRVPVADWMKPMLAGAVLGVAAIGMPDILGIGKETLRFAVIDQAFAPGELAFLLVAKLLATALCIGFGFAGGVLSPALLIGILFGAFAGNGVELLVGEFRSDIAIYAICGMVAVASAVIGAPLTTILIVFELTRNYDLATAAMVSVVFSNLVAYRIFGRSLFDVQLHLRGFDLSAGRDKVILERRSIEAHVSRDFVSLAPDLPLAKARSRLLAARCHEGYVVDTDGVCLGGVKLAEILSNEEPGEGGGFSSGEGVGALAKRVEPVFTPTTSVWAAMERMGDFVGETIPVVEADGGGRMLGVVSEAAIVKAYREAMDDIRREENAGV